jgi:hypothetical protein
MHTPPISKSSHLPILFAAVLGGIGFVCGFLGPIALSPNANQGPLLGLFITGPACAIGGLLLGFALTAFRPRPIIVRGALFMSAFLVTLCTLYLSLPEDQIACFIEEIEVVNCQQPAPLVEQKVPFWEEETKRVTWVTTRQGWKEDIPRMLRDDPGLILTVKVLRRRDIYTKQKPWNRGQYYATHWKAMDYRQECYLHTKSASCAAFQSGTRFIYLLDYDHSKEWPPKTIPGYLQLPYVAEVPIAYQRFTNE